MANPPISRIEFTSNSVVLIAGTQKFTFPLAGNTATALSLPAQDVQALLAAIQAHGDMSVAAARDAILTAIGSMGEVLTPPVSPTPDPTPDPTPAPAAGTAMTLNVGPSRAVKEIADAIPLMAPGGEIVVDDATYLKPFHSAVWDIRITSVSGNPFKCRIDMRGGNGGGVHMAYDKAAMHFSGQATVTGIGVVNAGSLTSGTNYSNEAAFYAEEFPRPGFLKLVRCAVDNSGNGVFIPANRGISGNITYIERECLFGSKAPNSQSNPNNSGPSHDRYIGCPVVDIDGSMDFGCTNGHSLKCGADTTQVKNAYMASFGGRAVELPYGGVGTFTNCTIVSRDDGNANFIGFADEQNRLPGTPILTFDGGQILVGRSPSVVLTGAGATIVINPNVKVSSFGGYISAEGAGTLKGLPAAVPTIGKPTPPALPAWATN